MTPFDQQYAVNDQYEAAKVSKECLQDVPTTQSTCTQTCGCNNEVGMDLYVPPQQQSLVNTEVPTTQSTCTQTCGCNGDFVEQADYVAPALV